MQRDKPSATVTMHFDKAKAPIVDSDGTVLSSVKVTAPEKALADIRYAVRDGVGFTFDNRAYAPGFVVMVEPVKERDDAA